MRSASFCLFAVLISTLSQASELSFAPVALYPLGQSTANLFVVADVNGDYKPDIVVANGHGSISVLLGNGDGTLQAAVPYGASSSSAVSLDLADVNGDGKLDTIVGHGDSSIGVLLAKGDGTFQAPMTYASGGGGASIAVSDVNGDRKLDIVVANGDGSIGILLGNGDGTFQTALLYSSQGVAADSLAVVDLNGDGKPDIAVGILCLIGTCDNGEHGGAGVLLGNGDGTFQTGVTYDSGGIWPTLDAVADLNGDGKPDLVMRNKASGWGHYFWVFPLVGVLLGNGDGTFQTAVTYSSGGESGASPVEVYDLNGDDKLDLVVANECSRDYLCGTQPFGSDGSISVLLGNGDGTFQTLTYDSGGIWATTPAVGDLNGDGKPDLVVLNLGAIAILQGNGDGTFQAPVSYPRGERELRVRCPT